MLRSILIVVLASCARVATAATAALPPVLPGQMSLPSAPRTSLAALQPAIASALGHAWNVSRSGDQIVVESKQKPTVLRYVNDPHEARKLALLGTDAERDAYRRRYRVDVRYRITVKLVPELSQSEVNRRLAHNRNLERRIQALRKLNRGGEKVLEGSEEYLSLWRQVTAVPCGRYAGASVFVAIDNLGAMTVVESSSYHEAQRAIVGLLKPYRGVRTLLASSSVVPGSSIPYPPGIPEIPAAYPF